MIACSEQNDQMLLSVTDVVCRISPDMVRAQDPLLIFERVQHRVAAGPSFELSHPLCGYFVHMGDCINETYRRRLCQKSGIYKRRLERRNSFYPTYRLLPRSPWRTSRRRCARKLRGRMLSDFL
jgi:hypothetical protein